MTPEEKFAVRCSAVVHELALFFANEPDGRVAAALADMRQNLIDKFVELFPSAPPGTMAAGVDSIVKAIQLRRREIEAAGATPCVLN